LGEKAESRGGKEWKESKGEKEGGGKGWADWR